MKTTALGTWGISREKTNVTTAIYNACAQEFVPDEFYDTVANIAQYLLQLHRILHHYLGSADIWYQSRSCSRYVRFSEKFILIEKFLCLPISRQILVVHSILGLILKAEKDFNYYCISEKYLFSWLGKRGCFFKKDLFTHFPMT